MPFKDGRMTPAEKRAMGKRYGVEEGTYRRAGANYMNDPSPGDYKERLVKASQNDYDTRKTQEFMNAALKDDELRKSLGKKAQKFLDNYKGGDKKDSGLIGISNFKELAAINDFGRLYHKHEKGGGGQFSSFNDYGGNTEHMGNALRKHYDRNFLTKDDQVEAPVDDAQTPDSLLPDDYTPSPELTRARDIVGTFEDGVLKSQDGLLSSAALGEIATKNTVANDTQTASSQNAIAQSYLDNHTLNLKEGFKKYGIRTSGPNSTASRNDELMQGLG